jgi:hypothetical protein
MSTKDDFVMNFSYLEKNAMTWKNVLACQHHESACHGAERTTMMVGLDLREQRTRGIAWH